MNSKSQAVRSLFTRSTVFHLIFVTIWYFALRKDKKQRENKKQLSLLCCPAGDLHYTFLSFCFWICAAQNHVGGQSSALEMRVMIKGGNNNDDNNPKRTQE